MVTSIQCLFVVFVVVVDDVIAVAVAVMLPPLLPSSSVVVKICVMYLVMLTAIKMRISKVVIERRKYILQNGLLLPETSINKKT